MIILIYIMIDSYFVKKKHRHLRELPLHTIELVNHDDF